MTAPAERPAWEVADVIRQYGEAFQDRHGGRLGGTQLQALQDLARCRTAALGGHVERCGDCGRDRIAYNSCRNRHCPKCQAQARARWLQREADNLLPVEYYHVVFTLPAEVAELALANRIALYDLLFQAAAATLREVAANPKRLGAQVGVLMVLHTWGQNLHHHPHVHAVVTGGGLSCDGRGDVTDSPQWVGCRPGFFLPVRVLSRVFRGKYLAGVRKLLAAGQLQLAGTLAGTGRTVGLLPLVDALVPPGLGGVRQASLWRPQAGVEVPGAVHPSGGHQQFAAGRCVGGTGDLPLQGLRRPTPVEDDDAVGRRVLASVHPACIAEGIREGPALRAFGQPLP